MTFDSQLNSPLSVSPYSSASAPTAMNDDVRLRSSGLTAIGVFCIVGGILGLLVGLIGIISLIFGAAMASAFVPTGPQQQVQQEMNSKIQEVTSAFMIPNVLIILGTISVCSCLLVGGIGVFGQRPRGRILLLKALLIAMILECLRVTLHVLTQLEMLPIMEEYMPKMMDQAGNNGPSGPLMGSMMRVMTLAGLGLSVLWGLVKLGLYAWGRSYLKKPPVIDFYNASQDGTVTTK